MPGPSPFVGPLPSRSMVTAFLSPEYFRAGEIHNHLSVWEHLLSGRGSSQVDLMEIIKEGVRIDRLFKPFRGNFKGSSYDLLFPPPMRLDNDKVCEQFRSFITDTVVDWVDPGILAVWGRVGEVTSPHLVLPLTVEPFKPRLCHDERFLNLWVKDLPFKLDHLPHLPGTFFLAICKPLLMIKVAINMCCSILRRGLSLAWNRMAFIFFLALSRSDGRRVLIYITISVLPFRVQHVRLFRVYWPSDPSADVNFLESRALVSFKSQLSNSRMDVRIDNKVLKSALDDDGCRNSAINEIIKELYRYSRDQNFSIQTFYVPSSHNPADEPSRKCSDLDCMLSVGAWLSLERLFGPHSFDLMSLDSYFQRDAYSNPPPHYTPWTTPGSAGINVFANPLPAGRNI